MITALSIRSFVLIDSLDLDASTGFTALTGETGAGKSIILDALGLVLGASANRKQVKGDAERASVAAEFALSEDHPAWATLRENGLVCDPTEALVLKRLVPASGPSRCLINDQPVSTALLQEVGEQLVEVHGQHAASGLMRPSSHRALLDAFGGHQDLVETCQERWRTLDEARQLHAGLQTAAREARARIDWLQFAVEDLGKLSPEVGEVERLVTQRAALLQSEKITETIDEAHAALRDKGLDDGLNTAARAIDRILRIPGLDLLEDDLASAARDTASAIERTLIELTEAQAMVSALSHFTGHDGERLDSVEGRLFALRAAARKYDCTPEALPDIHERHLAALRLCEADTEALASAAAAEEQALSDWQEAAHALTAARQSAAAALEHAIMKELEPLHLGRVRVRVAFADIGEGESGARGAERAEFEVETNPGAGFGPLKGVASGGELARFSLALKCALCTAGVAPTLIFDEADQGVGGAVAAAIGERLALLSRSRQVLAVTHSPQVASAASRQWRVMKVPLQNGELQTEVAQLDDGQRLEEIARMLSGSSITDEARAAASKLLEAA